MVVLRGQEPQPRRCTHVRGVSVRWTILLPSVFLFWIVSGFDKNGISVIVANAGFLRDLQLLHQPVLVGFLASGFTLTYGLFAFLSGWAVDRWGARRCALAGVALWGGR